MKALLFATMLAPFVCYARPREAESEGASAEKVSEMNCHTLSSREPRLYKRVYPSVRLSVRRCVRNFFFWRAETKTANDLFRVFELVKTSS